MAKAKKSKSKKSKGKKAASKEEVCETFDITKKEKGKDTIKIKTESKTVCGEMEKKQASKGEVKRYNKILIGSIVYMPKYLKKEKKCKTQLNS